MTRPLGVSPIRLDARRLRKVYSGGVVLDNVDLQVGWGEIRALVGENGAGKSTLIKILSGAVVPEAGEVRLDDELVPIGHPIAVRRLGVNVVYQEFTLVPDLSVSENLFLGQEIGRPFLDRGRMHHRASGLLRELGVVVDPRTRVGGLSVAHQQMVEIARALASDAKVLVLDEPSATLSPTDVARLHGVLRRLRSTGLAVLYVSHRLDEVFALADTATVLRDGRHVITSPVSALSREGLIRHMVGRDVTEAFPPRRSAPGEVVLTVRDLSAPPRLRQVSLDIRAGEVVGLAGLVGAGRTSTGLAIAGALPFTGRMQLRGRPLVVRSPAEAIRQGVAYVTEDRKTHGVFPWLGVDRNITVTHQAACQRGPFISGVRERGVALEAVRTFDIRVSGPTQLAGTLSGGNQQKALVARYVLKPPLVLILDEPTRGVDVGARAGIYRAMNRLTAEGLGILMISSDLPEVVGMSDRVVVMRAGCTVGELPRGNVTADRIMTLAALGGA